MERRKARRGRRRVTREEFWEEQKRDMDPAYGETKREAWRKKERDKPFRDMGTTAALFSDLAAMRPGRSSVGCPGGYPGACPKREGGTVHGQALYPADRPAGDAWYLPRCGPGPLGVSLRRPYLSGMAGRVLIPTFPSTDTSRLFDSSSSGREPEK